MQASATNAARGSSNHQKSSTNCPSVSMIRARPKVRGVTSYLGIVGMCFGLGCMTTTPWVHPTRNVSSYEQENDMNDCHLQVGSYPDDGSFYILLKKFEFCMKAKGYRRS